MYRAWHTVSFPSGCIVTCGSLGSNHFSQKFESILWPMPKQGGPYSRASTSTLGTLGPSKQIGLISLESISCIPPFNLEINIALLVGVEEANSVAIHRLFANRLTSWANCKLCVSGRVGPTVCWLSFKEGAVGQKGAEKSLSKSTGAKSGSRSSRTRETVHFMTKEKRKGPGFGEVWFFWV